MKRNLVNGLFWLEAATVLSMLAYKAGRKLGVVSGRRR